MLRWRVMSTTSPRPQQRELPPIPWQPEIPIGEATEFPSALCDAMWLSAMREQGLLDAARRNLRKSAVGWEGDR